MFDNKTLHNKIVARARVITLIKTLRDKTGG